MILITGATGAVGRPMAAALRERGVPVLALTRDSANAGFPSDAAFAAASR